MAERPSNEPEKLLEWCQVISGFLSRGMSAELAVPLEKAIVGASKRKSAKALQTLAKELAAWVRTLSPDLQNEINAELRARFGRAMDDDDDRQEVVRRVLARGRIQGAEEYRSIMNRVDEIHANDAASEELEKLNALLLEHDRRRTR